MTPGEHDGPSRPCGERRQQLGRRRRCGGGHASSRRPAAAGAPGRGQRVGEDGWLGGSAAAGDRFDSVMATLSSSDGAAGLRPGKNIRRNARSASRPRRCSCLTEPGERPSSSATWVMLRSAITRSSSPCAGHRATRSNNRRDLIGRVFSDRDLLGGFAAAPVQGRLVTELLGPAAAAAQLVHRPGVRDAEHQRPQAGRAAGQAGELV